ncbi:MAG: 3-methyl-2-oxobutanoate hydroxymethyltransferase [Alicyclobacillaceae bacterium]|nr:3-methyl-2-oxobutanoate hydroxymethyltransferase [Alicyclobacillaceae bacterium]
MSQITTKTLLQMKARGQKIAMVTAYDYPTAERMDAAGMHVLLIGDSLGMVVQGHSTTIPVTIDDMIYHTKMVARAAKQSMVVTDMPFLTQSISPEDALRHAGQILQEGGAQAVKLEGGREVAKTVARLVSAGIPVMGHIGLTPQSVHALGGFHVQGRTKQEALRLLDDALALEAAGAFSVVLEVVPGEVATVVSESLSIPTIGIGAGAGCDGQVLVFHDMMGYTAGYIPKHNKRYAEVGRTIEEAAKTYIEEVQSGLFPGTEQTIHLREDEREILLSLEAARLGRIRQNEPDTVEEPKK